jgi:DNA-binding beta-propeller fold protein YncE
LGDNSKQEASEVEMRQINEMNKCQLPAFKRVATAALISVLLVVGLNACSKKEAPTAKSVAYVSSQNGGITVYSLSDYSIIRQIEVGEGARGLGLSDDGKTLAVAVKETSDIAIIDTSTGTVRTRVPVGKNPEFVRVWGDRAFVAYEPSAKGGPPPKPGTPEFEAMKAKQAQEQEKDGDDDEPPAQIAVIDMVKGLKLREFTAGMETEGIEFNGDGTQVVVTNEADENVSVHNIESGELVKKIDTKSHGIRPRGIKRSPDDKEFAVTLEYGNKLLILDEQYNIVREAATGDVPYGVTYNKVGDEILVALSKGEKIQVFDSKSLQLKREYPVGKRCWHFSFTPDEKNLIVACGRSSEILILDAKTGAKVKSLPDDKLPWGVVVYPKAKGSLDTPKS